jgi:AcrR family transcriptional regulator
LSSHPDPSWPPDLTELEALIGDGCVRPTFVRLAAERRTAILEAALTAAAENGPGRLNIKEVASRAAVPVGSLYQYFGGRDALVRLVCLLVTRRLESILACAAPLLENLPLADALSQYLDESLKWCSREPTLMRIYSIAAYNVAFLRDPRDSPEDPDVFIVTAIAKSMLSVSETLLGAAARRRELREGVDIDAASRILNALLIAVTDAALLPGLNAYYRLYDARRGQKRMLQAIVDFACNGLLRHPPAAAQRRAHTRPKAARTRDG